MTYVLTNAHVVPMQLDNRATRAAPANPGLFSRLYAAMIESRLRTAEREIRARTLLVNEAGIMMGDVPFASVTRADALPFDR